MKSDQPSAPPLDLLISRFDEALGRVSMYGPADQVRDAWQRLRVAFAQVQAERENMRVRAYRQARVFEPSMDGYAGAMATFRAAFPEDETDGDVAGIHIAYLNGSELEKAQQRAAHAEAELAALRAKLTLKEVRPSVESMQLPAALDRDDETALSGARQSVEGGVTHPPKNTSPLTADDIDQIVEGIEHFVIGPSDEDGELTAIWQPYIDKLIVLKTLCETRSPDGDGPEGAPKRQHEAARNREPRHNAQIEGQRHAEQCDQQTVGVQGHGGKPQTVNAGDGCSGSAQTNTPRLAVQGAGSEPAESHSPPIASWRLNVDQIGPQLEGAAFQQCADQLEQLVSEATPLPDRSDLVRRLRSIGPGMGLQEVLSIVREAADALEGLDG